MIKFPHGKSTATDLADTVDDHKAFRIDFTDQFFYFKKFSIGNYAEYDLGFRMHITPFSIQQSYAPIDLCQDCVTDFPIFIADDLELSAAFSMRSILSSTMV